MKSDIYWKDYSFQYSPVSERTLFRLKFPVFTPVSSWWKWLMTNSNVEKSVEWWWREKQTIWRNKMSQCHISHHKTHRNWTGTCTQGSAAKHRLLAAWKLYIKIQFVPHRELDISPLQKPISYVNTLMCTLCARCRVFKCWYQVVRRVTTAILRVECLKILFCS